MSIKSTLSSIRNAIGKIGPRIQGDNYGTGTVIGGKTYYQTGPTQTTTGVSSKNVGGSSSGGKTYYTSSGGGSSGGVIYTSSGPSQEEFQKQLEEQARQESIKQLQQKLRQEQLAKQTQTALRSQGFSSAYTSNKPKENILTKTIKNLTGKSNFFTPTTPIYPSYNIRNTKTITIQKGGGIIIESGNDKNKYIGNQYIQEVGMTANEYRQKVIRDAVKKGMIIKTRERERPITYQDTGSMDFTSTIKEKLVEQPRIQFKQQPTDWSTYDSRTNTFMTQSPTGVSGTAYMRQPTPSEQIIIDINKQKGSAEYLYEQAGEVATRVYEAEPIKKTIEVVREVPVDLPFYEGTTLGETVVEFKEKTKDLIDLSKKGWMDISERATKYGEKTGAKFFTGIGYSAKGTEKLLVPIAEPFIQYSTLGAIGGGALDIIGIEERKSKPQKEIEQAKVEGYKEYEKEYEKAKKELKEGYELEKKLSYNEYKNSEYGKEIEQRVKTNFGKELVIPSLFVAGGILGKTGAFIKDRQIGKAIQKESPTLPIDKLMKKKIKGVSIVEEKTGGSYVGAGFRKFKNLREDLILVGEKFKTPSGKEQIITGFGERTITTKVTPKVFGIKLSPREIKITDPFVFRARGDALKLGYLNKGVKVSDVGDIFKLRQFEKGIVIGKTGKLPIYERLGTTTTFSKEGLSQEITLPTKSRNILIKLNKNIGLSESARERVVSLTIPKPTETKTLNFITGGKKSSNLFLKNLYKEQPQVSLSEVSSSLKKPTFIPTETTRIKSINVVREVPEVTTVSTISPTRVSITSNALIDVKDKSTSLIIPKELRDQEKLDDVIKFDSKIKTFNRTKQKDKIIETPKPKEKQITFSIPKLTTSQIQIPKITQTFKSKLKTRQIQTPKIIPKINLRQPTPNQTKIKIPITPFDFEQSRLKKVQPNNSQEEFLVITKRYGKEVVIGKGKDLGKLVSLGKSRIKTTLGATLKAQTTKGKQIKLTPTKGFRPGKRDSLSIVQIRETRLGSFGERKEIKQSRKGVLSLL